MNFLKKHTLTQCQQLIEISCSDNVSKTQRFSIVYVLNSIFYSNRILVRIQTNEVKPVPSVTELFPSAGWLEREVYDLFGVFFYEHPDLRRILTDYGFNGHPLRKDFPLSGFIEIYYNDATKRLAYEPVELAQELRMYSLTNPWVATKPKDIEEDINIDEIDDKKEDLEIENTENNNEDDKKNYKDDNVIEITELNTWKEQDYNKFKEEYVNYLVTDLADFEDDIENNEHNKDNENNKEEEIKRAAKAFWVTKFKQNFNEKKTK